MGDHLGLLDTVSSLGPKCLTKQNSSRKVKIGIYQTSLLRQIQHKVVFCLANSAYGLVMPKIAPSAFFFMRRFRHQWLSLILMSRRCLEGVMKLSQMIISDHNWLEILIMPDQSYIQLRKPFSDSLSNCIVLIKRLSFIGTR